MWQSGFVVRTKVAKDARMPLSRPGPKGMPDIVYLSNSAFYPVGRRNYGRKVIRLGARPQGDTWAIG